MTNIDEFLGALRTVATAASSTRRSSPSCLGVSDERTPYRSSRRANARFSSSWRTAGPTPASHENWVTEGAVEKYIKNILSKLEIGADAEVHRRVLAVLAYLNSR